MSNFAAKLIRWQKRHGRHDLPWQGTRDPYRIWLSEIMLQQTQVATVIPYYLRFLQRCPTIHSLADASPDEALALWSGLGYYSRARNLHQAARLVVARYGGRFPETAEEIEALPGIGRSTAAAIAVFAYGERRAILDGNVKRVFARCFGIEGYPGDKKVENALWARAEAVLPQVGIESYTQGLMDLGATVCKRTNPDCGECPLRHECVAHRERRVSELPTPRPRKPLPEKEAALLMLIDRGRILLEKRPPSGIWGGMWSLPETLPDQDPVAYCAATLGAEVVSLAALPDLEHGFTHFKLRIHPRLLRVLAVLPRAEERGHVWLDIDDALGAAIPAPVRKLLKALNGSARKR